MTADASKKTTTHALDKLAALLDEGHIHLYRGDRAALAESPARVQQTAATIFGPLTGCVPVARRSIGDQRRTAPDCVQPGACTGSVRVYDYGASAFDVRGCDVGRSRCSTPRGDAMPTVSRSSSLLRVIKWACLGPFVVLGGLLLLIFGLGALAIAVRLLGVLLS